MSTVPSNATVDVPAARRVALIALWFGPLPSWFDLFLASCATNPDYTWLVLGDQSRPDHAPANVRFLPLSFADINRRIGDALGISTRIASPYKLCDVRPMYGLVFADLLRDFSHWGHCDLDVIWGRLADFLGDDLFLAYPHVQEKGHLAIFRNDEATNHFFMLEAPGVPNWRTVLAQETRSFYFDEWDGINRILGHRGVPRAPVAPVADVLAPRGRFHLFGHPDHRVQAFAWHDGRVLRHFLDDATGRLGCDEFAYIHLQKRRLPPPPFQRIPDLGYWITPHGFFPRLSADPDVCTIRSMNRPSWRHRAFVVRWRAGNVWRKLRGTGGHGRERVET